MQVPALADNTAELNDNSVPQLDALPRQFERFTLLKRIARGGMGEVYLGATGGIEGAERPVVVKLIRRDHETDASFLARFLDEARIQSQLQHPGVAQILDAANDELGKPYVVVEYVEGRNLADVRSRAGQLGVRIAWAEALALAIVMGGALAHVHERTDPSGKPLEIVHRDLSPQNVMVGYDGDVKLIDFGTARGENRRCHTIAGIVFAKPGYVAPEVANNQPGGVPADLYAFGVMLWELIAGRRFLVGDASLHLAAVGSGRRVPTPIAQAAGAPLDLDQVITKLTATSIEDRYACARDAVGDLVKVLQRAPSLADGDRSVRGRIAHLMRRLYPAEPTRSRAEFARLVAEARKKPAPEPMLPPSPEPPAASEDGALLPGTRYRVADELGRGGSGVVFRALHVDLGRKVALKVLHQASDNASIDRFRSEARAIAHIEHPHLVRLYDFGTTGDARPFYAMELLEGEPLDKKLECEGALPWRAAVALLLQAASAVDAAHAAGVIHRDIKPHNLFLCNDGTLKLLDFGVAKAESEIELENESEAGALVVMGTPEYMAPEQAAGVADARSDVYALGAVLHQLLCGRLPHEGDSPVAIIERKSSQEARPLRESAPERALPAALDAVVSRALARLPADRFQSAAELRQALLSTLAPAPAASRPRKRAATALASTITLVVSIVFGATAAHPLTRSKVSAAARDLVQAARSLNARALAPEVGAQAKASALAQPPKTITTAEAAPADPDLMQVAPAAVAVVTPGPALAEDAEVETFAEAAAPALQPNGAEPASPEPSVEDERVNKALTEAARLAAGNARIKALHVLRRAGRTNPKDGRLLKAWVAAAEELRAWGEARRVARQWAEADQGYEARIVLARLERATGNRDRAVRILKELAARTPESNEVRELLALYSGSERLALNH